MAGIVILCTLLAASFAAALALGTQALPLAEVWAALTGDAPPQAEMIVSVLRLPRALLAVLVGAALAVSGAVTQAIMRNPLADPGILGINSGAALMAVLTLVQIDSLPVSALPWLTFAGALTMALAITALAWQQGTSSLRIILVGIGLSAFTGALASFASTFGDIVAVQRAMVWLTGSLQEARMAQVQVLALWLVLPLARLWLAARDLDLIAFGDKTARALGQRVNLTRVAMIVAVAAVSGAAVAAAGLVGFVGLAAPHIARRIGTLGQSHTTLLPASALVGAVMVLLADLVARLSLAPVQLPVGLVTGLIGAPFMGWLLWGRRHG